MLGWVDPRHQQRPLSHVTGTSLEALLIAIQQHFSRVCMVTKILAAASATGC